MMIASAGNCKAELFSAASDHCQTFVKEQIYFNLLYQRLTYDHHKLLSTGIPHYIISARTGRTYGSTTGSEWLELQFNADAVMLLRHRI